MCRVTSSVLTRKWVLYGALVFLLLLCMYSIISDVTYGLAFTSVKCTWHLVFHVCVNRCNQEGVGILLLLMSKSIFVFRPSHLECMHHFPNFPLSQAASIRCWHLLCYSLIAFQGELAQNTPAVPNNPKWCECVYSIGSAWLWFQTLDTQGFIFAWLSEQRRTPQLSSSGLRSTSCGVAAFRVYNVMRVRHNLGIVYHAVATVEALLRTALYVHTCPPILNVFRDLPGSDCLKNTYNIFFIFIYVYLLIDYYIDYLLHSDDNCFSFCLSATASGPGKARSGMSNEIFAPHT